MTNRTEWFKSSEHNPARPGVYLIRRRDRVLFWRAFDGKNWHMGFNANVYRQSPNYGAAAARGQLKISDEFFREFEWCGLTEEPK